MKYSFKNDYSELCHPALLEALLKASTEQNTGYGLISIQKMQST